MRGCCSHFTSQRWDYINRHCLISSTLCCLIIPCFPLEKELAWLDWIRIQEQQDKKTLPEKSNGNRWSLAEGKISKTISQITSDQLLFWLEWKRKKKQMPIREQTKGGSYANRMVIMRGILPRFHKSFKVRARFCLPSPTFNFSYQHRHTDTRTEHLCLPLFSFWKCWYENFSFYLLIFSRRAHLPIKPKGERKKLKKTKGKWTDRMKRLSLFVWWRMKLLKQWTVRELQLLPYRELVIDSRMHIINLDE